MLEFIRKSPLGFALATTALVLTVSPEAREAARRLAVKGTAAVLDLVEQARGSARLPSPQVPCPELSVDLQRDGAGRQSDEKKETDGQRS